ncbi:hypothetical protein CRE_16259 [Caenorhabditis remanei]|uniref:Uncharacterized protein n=1 Tax=Caenorhabditis remanei TaxID=31234 RepID=E3N2K0_CAERE|nr:hypothetical protein CRE_16259 [Caenorhabditis remanei]
MRDKPNRDEPNRTETECETNRDEPGPNSRGTRMNSRYSRDRVSCEATL